MKLPKDFFAKGISMKESKLFGTRLEDFTHEELVAIAAVGWYNYNTLKKQNEEADKEITRLSKHSDKLWEQFDRTMDSAFRKQRDKDDLLH